jgi:hypothetical protein
VTGNKQAGREGDREGGGPPVPVLILNHRGWNDTIALARRLWPEQGTNLWVVDNGSPVDRSAELLAAVPGIGFLALGRNWGWAGGYNRAIARLRGEDAVFLLNNDALPEPGAIGRAVAALRTRPGTAAVGCALLTGDGGRVLFDGTFRHPPDGTPGPLAALPAGPVPARSVHGAAFALSLAAWDAVGPFHEPYFLYHEESEWCLRARAAGWALAVHGGARVRHDGGGSDRGDRDYYLARNRYLALRRGLPLARSATTTGALVDQDLRDARRCPSRRAAVLQGAADGVAGRFGQRVARRPGAAALAGLYARRFLFRVRRRLGLAREAPEQPYVFD